MIYKVIILGAGPGGYNAALRAAEAGLSVLLFEKDKVGGVCLNEGCVPSKSLLYSAKLLDNAKQGEKYGVYIENPHIDQNKVIDRKNKVVRTLTAGIKSALKNAGVETISNAARLVDKAKGLFTVESEGTKYQAENVIIATGSSVALPKIKGVREGIDSGFVLTSKEMLDLREIPKKLIVVGGGVIGLEMASYYSSVGSEVSVIEMFHKIGGAIDEEISTLLQKSCEKKGISFYLQAKLIEVTKDSAIFETAGERCDLKADKLLMSIGRTANTADYGLDKFGVEYTVKGVTVDTGCRTNIEGLYAIGDVNGKVMLAHTAYREGEVVINNILGKDDNVCYDIIPAVVYTNPEVASVGLTEEAAISKGIECEAKTISMRFSGRYLAENDGGTGICKLVTDKKTKTLIGVHMMGNYSSEIIYGAGMLVQNKTPIDDIKKIVFPHPTVAEIIREAVFEITG